MIVCKGLRSGFRVKGRNYRTPSGQAYSRDEYIHGAPLPKITKYVMGDAKASYQYRLSLLSKAPVQIRHNALEAIRVATNKILADKLGETGYLLHVRPYPHIVLRENKMIATAGADRLQEGMRKAFGKPIGRAARITANQSIIDIYVNDNAIEVAMEALRVGSTKLPVPCTLKVEELAANQRDAIT